MGNSKGKAEYANSDIKQESKEDVVSKLIINIIQARNVPSYDVNGKSDPYVKVKIGKDSYRTQVAKRELNPVWNSKICSEGKNLMAEMKEISLELFDYDSHSKDDKIGDFVIQLGNLKAGEDFESPVQWYDLKYFNLNKKSDKKCQIQIAIRFVYNIRHLTVAKWTNVLELTIKNGTNFKNMDFLTKNDPYLQINYGSLTYNTAVAKNSKNPIWNATQYIFVDKEAHQNYSIRLTAMDKDLNSDDRIGAGFLQMKHIIANEQKQGDKIHKYIVPIHVAKIKLDKNLKMKYDKQTSAGEIVVEAALIDKKTIEDSFYDSIIASFDKDGNGVLDKDEVTQMFTTLGYHSGMVNIEDWMKQFDTDYSGSLEKKEIKAILNDPRFQKDSLAPKLIYNHLKHKHSEEKKSGNGQDFTRSLMTGVTEENGDDGSEINIKIKDRTTGLLVQEHIPGYVKLSLQLLYDARLSRAIAGTGVVKKILKKMSVKEGKKFDQPESTKSIPGFIKQHALDTSILKKQLHEFETYNDFFARALKPEARPLGDHDVISPADSRFSCWSNILDSTKFWIKGKKFTVGNLFGAERAAQGGIEQFEGGSFMINRLAPQDYHRWHYPVTGKVTKITPVDGALYTVNPIAINKTVDVYTENKRCVIEIDASESGLGNVVMFAISATMVGSYNLFFTDDNGNEMPLMAAELPVQVKKGTVAGEFRFGGSTVLTLFQPGVVKFNPDLVENCKAYLETLIVANENIALKINK